MSKGENVSANLHVIESSRPTEKKRRLFRVSSAHLSFKLRPEEHAMEVLDLNKSGAQIALRESPKDLTIGPIFSGELSWNGEKLSFDFKVEWLREKRMGISFVKASNVREVIEKWMRPERMAHLLRNVSSSDSPWEWPEDVSLCLYADGPCGLVARHNNLLEWKDLFIFFFDRFLEWTPEQSLTSGRILSKRSDDSALWLQEEVLLRYHQRPDDSAMKQITTLVEKISPRVLAQDKKEKILHLIRQA